MWFNNARIYQYELDASIDLRESLDSHALKPCPPHARFIYGWMPALSQELMHETSGSTLFCMGKEERILPRGVIKQHLNERIQTLEMQQGRTIKRAEKAQMAEELEFELLPKSFCLQKRLPALLDQVSKRLIMNTASSNQSSQLIALLRKSCPAIHIEPLQTMENLALRFASWISNPSLLPPSLQLASDCLLVSMEDDKKRFHCKGYELPAEEILTLLSQGLAAAEISVIWKDRIQLTVTQDFTFKKLKCLDYLTDEFQQAQQYEDDAQKEDAALILLAGELRALTDDLLAEVSNVVMNTPTQGETPIIAHLQ